MHFEEGIIFHVFNQGNNREVICKERNDYLTFIHKMRIQILPFGDLVSYCIMPNHFHWQIFVKYPELSKKEFDNKSHQYLLEYSKWKNKTSPVKRNASDHEKGSEAKFSLNLSIGVLLRSYTNYYNIKYKRSGGLFRPKTKAKSSFIDEFITVDMDYQGSQNYNYICLNYIHNNPVKAGLVNKEEKWEFSSAKDYLGLRNGKICNLELGRKIITEL